MNNQLVKINNTDLQIKEFRNQRIVTLKDIDTLHQRPEGTARRNFNENKKHFIVDEDYFKISASEIRTHKIMDISNMVREDVTFLTESGYLMLVKSFTDDLAWTIQRQLVNGYFRAKNNQPIGLLENLQSELNNTRQELSELKQMFLDRERVKALKTGASMNERLSLVSDKDIKEIINSALSIGVLREVDNGIAIDRNIVLIEASKKNIDKYTLNKKLVISGIVILGSDNYPYKQVRVKGNNQWCYVVKKNELGE
ncbi:ORF6N domain-containing protein [Clostridium botulinum]|uniref:ORF6N domain-containing protein n=1 Tax=Clostridium botulinum TaxID=1491 RepID=A0A6B4JIE6_CLOBO|nr:ORF6N domain-containing protein [Clostridium botulinum]EES50987.1 conserved hypothetical protein [Clostridium botulinum E1 str. 'BoNT E Beluga']MBY6760676.1 ORF6N domain-containing protein [Clostridium botulinum]MBY6919583.1 ORF6N domain-containing protein [Clostridium botulinum]MCR1130462.1 ORF6N domain-containing protein [Clostridium botulinum]NFJ56786.1 ORF6N domain-containing protein [Clostridium botulinum]